MPFDDNPARPDTGMPCAFGLLVATLALMTAHASPAPEARVGAVVASTQRRLMAHKIVSNLFFLQHHPDAPPPLRRVAANLHARWLPMAGKPGKPPSADADAPVPAGTRWH
jgi:hypothetical protein